jgi:hypothetical protein
MRLETTMVSLVCAESGAAAAANAAATQMRGRRGEKIVRGMAIL